MSRTAALSETQVAHPHMRKGKVKGLACHQRAPQSWAGTWLLRCCAHSCPTQWHGPGHTLSGSGPSLLRVIPRSLRLPNTNLPCQPIPAEPACPGASGTIQNLQPKTSEEIWMSESECHSLILKMLPDISTKFILFAGPDPSASVPYPRTSCSSKRSDLASL